MERINLTFDCCNGTSPNAPQHKTALTSDNLASAATMQALTKMIGAGFQDEDWASEGEEVAEEDAVNISLARSELEIMGALGGYVVTRLSCQKKLSCDRCRSELVTSEQGTLLQERQRDGKQLLSASRSLKTFLSTAEAVFRTAMANDSFCVEGQIGLKLRCQILAKVPRLSCCHPESAAAAILTFFKITYPPPMQVA